LPRVDAGSKPTAMNDGTGGMSQTPSGQGDGGFGGLDAAILDASAGDGGIDTPDDPDKPVQNGGLKCGDVFCPFADAPIEPCCTTDGDVEDGLANATDHCGLSFAATGSDF